MSDDGSSLSVGQYVDRTIRLLEEAERLRLEADRKAKHAAASGDLDKLCEDPESVLGSAVQFNLLKRRFDELARPLAIAAYALGIDAAPLDDFIRTGKSALVLGAIQVLRKIQAEDLKRTVPIKPQALIASSTPPFIWDLYPLAMRAWPNQQAETDAPPGGRFTLKQRIDRRVTGPWAKAGGGITRTQAMYCPTPENLATLQDAFPNQNPEQPSWANIEAELIVAGHAKSELEKLNAPTLLRLLAKACPAIPAEGERMPAGNYIERNIGTIEQAESLLLEAQRKSEQAAQAGEIEMLGNDPSAPRGNADMFGPAPSMLRSIQGEDLRRSMLRNNKQRIAEVSEDVRQRVDALRQQELQEQEQRRLDRYLRDMPREINPLPDRKPKPPVEARPEPPAGSSAKCGDPYRPATWFRDQFGIPASRLRAARRDGRLSAIDTGKTRPSYIYCVREAMRLWPDDGIYLPDADG